MQDLKKQNLTGIALLVYIIGRLRDPLNGCPWDIEQTFESIAPYTIEEAYEVADAIDHKDMLSFKEELGDLLLQVIFHSHMASEKGLFTLNNVIDSICNKMIKRHPHVFGNVEKKSSKQQSVDWETQKALERDELFPGNSILDGVAQNLPALLRAFKLQKRAARVGFDWPDVKGAFNKLKEEINELNDEITAFPNDQERISDELGDVLFSAVNLARKLKINPELALKQGNLKFETRFKYIEDTIKDQNKKFDDVALTELEAIWQKAKKL
jgi:ATP diphosphatase